MYTWGRRLRFTVVSAMVVLALTGFSSGRGHRSRSHYGGGGGGCSSSRQDHDSSSSTTSGGGGSYGSGSSSSDPYGSSSRSPGDDAYGSGTSTSGSSGGTYRSRPTYRSTPTTTSSGTARSLKDGTAVLVHCASQEDPYTTVEVRNPNGREVLFTVKVGFKDSADFTMTDATSQVSVPAKGKATVRVAAAGTGAVDRIDHCEVDPKAEAVR
ncbi:MULTISPECIES: hypothetical protein [unclassified Streptomyces]|jgi:hypothetical protein|uniref:hypothetical protein n=1 Tax=unclassified Streptomyces TaxID=2593676 RepID=UPI002E272E33